MHRHGRRAQRAVALGTQVVGVDLLAKRDHPFGAVDVRADRGRRLGERDRRAAMQYAVRLMHGRRHGHRDHDAVFRYLLERQAEGVMHRPTGSLDQSRLALVYLRCHRMLRARIW